MTKAEAIVAQLLANAAEVRYGSVSVSAKVHDGRVVDISYTKTEQTREKEPRQSNNEACWQGRKLAAIQQNS
jgi:hypothetical protein